MATQIGYARAARTDLIEIWLFIARDDVAAADRQIDRIERAVERLIAFPDIGHRCDEAGPGTRLLLRDRYLIVYRHSADENRVTILRIVHGSRNLASLFE